MIWFCIGFFCGGIADIIASRVASIIVKKVKDRKAPKQESKEEEIIE